MKNRYLLGLLIFALAPLYLSAQVTKTERFDFPAGGVLRLHNSTGEMTIEGWDRPDVEITTSEKTQITANRHDNQLVVDTKSAPSHVEYRISAPRNAALVVEHGPGEVHVNDWSGNIQVKVSRGSMSLRLPEENSYSIDAKAFAGNIVSDFPGKWHHHLLMLGSRYDQDASASRKLRLRAAFGDIAILKVRRPPFRPSNLFRQEDEIRLK